MLSRHAEQLFWTGRYVERAADTARMLDVSYHGLLGLPLQESRQGWRDLLDVLQAAEGFAKQDELVDARSVCRYLATEPGNTGSILTSVSRARENARSVRELLSTEVWESINNFWLELQARDLARDLDQQPYELYRLVWRRCQEVAGTVAETMPHDDGWRFLRIGTMLERAGITCRLLNVHLAQFTESNEELDFHEALQVLKAASASEAFRRAHPAAMTLHNVAQFLLVSPTFPRSVLFCLRVAESELQELDVPGHVSRAMRVLGRRKAELEFADVAELIASDLHGFLDEVQADIRRAADLVAIQYFRHNDEFAVFHSLERLP
jgi:uncharacterized alpha-E superfamily protein